MSQFIVPSSSAIEALKLHTNARIGLGRAGISQPTQHLLRFNADHALAKDAIYSEFSSRKLVEQLKELSMPSIEICSMAKDRQEYLQRPDLGRKLSIESREKLSETLFPKTDIGITVADGLSARAVNENFIPFLLHFIEHIKKEKWSFAPVFIASQARVALGDEIGEISHSTFSIICIGERPGLSSHNSMGIYVTMNPHQGLTDESRNCISNIRPNGLTPQNAAQELYQLLKTIKEKGYSGVRKER